MGSDLSVVSAARVSFNEYLEPDFIYVLDERDEKLIKFLAKHQHTSPFEHVTATFRLTVPMFIARQIMRHRTFSYNEISRRYTSADIKLWYCDSWRGQSDKNLQCSSGQLTDHISTEIYKETVSKALIAYNALLDRGIAREQARAVLPQCTYTSFYMTGNLHNWMHFLKLRLDAHAQPEVQVVAEAIKSKLLLICPASVAALLDI
jgi:thymidylate synthase (FAD)